MPVNVSSGTKTPSSQVSTTLPVPFTIRCSSTACQPGPGVTELTVPVASASLRKASRPAGVRYRYPPLPVGMSRSRSRVTCDAWLFTRNAVRAYPSV